jgi:hypothetical protein
MIMAEIAENNCKTPQMPTPPLESTVMKMFLRAAGLSEPSAGFEHLPTAVARRGAPLCEVFLAECPTVIILCTY